MNEKQSYGWAAFGLTAVVITLVLSLVAALASGDWRYLVMTAACYWVLHRA